MPGGDPAGYASAIVVEAGGRKQYVQFLSNGIVGVDAKTGKFLWRYKEVVKGMAQIPTPVARDGYVYAGAMNIGGGLVRLKAGRRWGRGRAGLLRARSAKRHWRSGASWRLSLRHGRRRAYVGCG